MFFTDPSPSEIYTLSLHDALPIWSQSKSFSSCARIGRIFSFSASSPLRFNSTYPCRSEERFSRNAETELVCRLLLEKTTLTVSCLGRWSIQASTAYLLLLGLLLPT